MQYTSKCDVWSIGIIYYFMLFGDTPWPCRDVNSYLANIKSKPLMFPCTRSVCKKSFDFIT